MQPMDAARAIAFADVLRKHARDSGCDINTANLFAHTLLLRAILAERREQDEAADGDKRDADAA